ncbi:hypothetical protein XELAEV_18024620mg [Xenopus laevis]|uniref:Uncharacterized protein n=1 Tax=Xenopus laevis TaxID=8355 RepID=A0A974D0U4_XENLA|nr:hypothetical protein XELAEV_18024620mg [Xenopus laevis]
MLNYGAQLWNKEPILRHCILLKNDSREQPVCAENSNSTAFWQYKDLGQPLWQQSLHFCTAGTGEFKGQAIFNIKP